jgi:carboxyl-terminal processing protease
VGLIKIILSITFFISPLFSKGIPLKQENIPIIMERFFNYHVEKKKMTKKLFKRALKIYIEQFDSEKIYLLNSEINSFLQMSDIELDKAIDNYKTGNFDIFKKINRTIQYSILRAQKLRESLKRETLNTNDYNFLENDQSKYAENERELYLRQKLRLYRFFAFHQKNSELSTKRRKILAFNLYERKHRQLEYCYLFLKGDNKAMNISESDHIFSQKILKAMAKALDAHTTFFTEEEATEMRINLEKKFEGIGVVLTEGIDGVIITDLVTGSPAYLSQKIDINDLVIEINDTSLKNLSFSEILQLMKAKGSNVIKLGLISSKNKKKKQVLLKKAPIVMDDDRLSYEVESFGNGYIAKLTLKSFYENGSDISSEIDIKKAIDEISKKGPIYGVILDLRDNAGGFLSQAVKVTGLFISSGVVVISKYSENTVHFLRKIDVKPFYNGPLVILTSKISASAAEIVAQSLQDYGAAIIAGDERTFGKGSIQFQTVTDEKAEIFFKVTVGKYYTVSGKTTQVEGVKADILVPTALAPFQIGEKYLEYPLSSDRIDSAYQDELKDLDMQARGWFKQNYLPYLQKKITYWHRMLPLLKENSTYRIQNNEAYQHFLEASKNNNLWRDQNDIYGDLQMNQASNILKDMIYMERKTKIDAEKAFSKKYYFQK